jgi:hypothetical protein
MSDGVFWTGFLLLLAGTWFALVEKQGGNASWFVCAGVLVWAMPVPFTALVTAATGFLRGVPA